MYVFENKTITILGAAILGVFGIAYTSAPAIAQGLQLAADQPRIVGEAAAVRADARPKPTTDANGRAIYIVQLADPPVASYRGGIANLKATSLAATGAARFDGKSPASVAYTGHLKSLQQSFVDLSERSIGRNVAVPFTYQHAFNGLAMELTASEAAKVARMPGVVRVERERIEVLLTDAGPQFIGAPDIWNGSSSLPASKGEGAVIAVLDTGINHDHPSFADIGVDGYDHTNPLGAGNYLPGSYCDTTDPSFCNDKLIGAYSFVPSDANFPVPEDDDQHGSHTAGTAGGNVVTAAAVEAPTTFFTRNVSGVAPHANIIAYDVCVDGCPGAALLAAVNQVVIDSGNLPNGITSINYSISGGGDPYNDSVELGFLAATDAGIYVSASAGNSGPAASTVAHLGPWVGTTAASTHNRIIVNRLTNLTSDGGGLGDITGTGITSGFGPAPIVHASQFPTSNGSSNDTDPAQCLESFPAGHFNGEIVVCDRGTISRVAKGENVLAGGAGGFVLANTTQGEGVVADPHVLPGVHVGASAANGLRSWLASNQDENPVATISGYEVDLDPANGDIMAGFSSRGPQLAFDVLKPDITAPGVDILAAADTDGVTFSPEFVIISGTSMSSPHHAGSAALMKAVRPDWSPHQIKSALMMTSTNANSVKEDGITPADPFDLGAGRIDLTRAVNAGLVLDETTANFQAADPSIGGDPKTLNIASMADGTCVASCSWTRTVTNTLATSETWQLSMPASNGIAFDVDPTAISLAPGESADITVTAYDNGGTMGHVFAELLLVPQSGGPDLHMPIAVQTQASTNPELFNKTVDLAVADEGQFLNYEIGVVNGTVADPMTIVDSIPLGVAYVPGSGVVTINNGTQTAPLAVVGNTLTTEVQLDAGAALLNDGLSPFGYISLASLGVAPFGCPINCDDGGFILNVPTFSYLGQAYDQVHWSVNGTLEAGAASGLAASASNGQLPDATVPNNLLAPLWTDLNLGAGGQWYVANLTAGPNAYTVYEWEDIPLFGNPAERYTFQIWVETSPSDGIWFVYSTLGNVGFMTVGIENDDGTLGDSYYYNGTGIAPTPGQELKVDVQVAGTAAINFQAQMMSCADGSETKLNTANLSAGSLTETAAAVTACVPGPDFDGDGDPDFSDPDDDNDGLDDVDEATIGTDPFDPDSDDDGIGDARDTEPLTDNNQCSGGTDSDATMHGTVELPLTCAAHETITVLTPTIVQDPGHLSLIAPIVIFNSGFQAGWLSVTSADPCPNCTPP